jgi:hypothetical protein
MRSVRSHLPRIAATALISGIFFLASCSKDSPGNTSALYVPAAGDATANATLQELQQGRVIYIDNCGSCHSLYTPDEFSASQWSGIMNSMAPKAGLSSGDKALALKYVTRGK